MTDEEKKELINQEVKRDKSKKNKAGAYRQPLFYFYYVHITCSRYCSYNLPFRLHY